MTEPEQEGDVYYVVYSTTNTLLTKEQALKQAATYFSPGYGYREGILLKAVGKLIADGFATVPKLPVTKIVPVATSVREQGGTLKTSIF